MRYPLAVVLCLVFQLAQAQQRPLQTETTETVPDGKAQAELGVEWLNDVTYTLSGLKGDLSRVGVFALRVGVGDRAELQFKGAALERLAISERFPAPNSSILTFNGSSTRDVGDLILGAKFRLRNESENAPAFGFHFAVQLPNASNESGLGNDVTSAFASILVGKKIGKARLSGTVGLAILGSPVDVASQDDLTLYGVALSWPASSRVDLVGEFYGRAGPGWFGTEEQTRLRLGARFKAAGFYWDAAALAGFQKTDPSWGIGFGVSRQFNLSF